MRSRPAVLTLVALICLGASAEVKVCGDNGREPKLAWTGSRFAAVYDVSINVALRTVDRVGQPVSPEILVVAGANGPDALVVAGSVLAIAKATTQTTWFTAFDEFGNTVIPPVILNPPVDPVDDASLTWTGSRYYVTWTRGFGSQQSDIRLAALDPAGAIVVSETTVIPSRSVYPAIAWNAAVQQLGVAWGDVSPGPIVTFMGANVTATGQLAGTTEALSDGTHWDRSLMPFEDGFLLGSNKVGSALFSRMDGAMDPIAPTVALPGDHRKVGNLVWTGAAFVWPVEYWDSAGPAYDIYVYRLDRNGGTLGQIERITSQNSVLGGFEDGPSAAFAGNVVGVVWQDFREDPWDSLPDVWFQHVPTIELLVGGGAGAGNPPQVRSRSALRGHAVLDFRPYGGSGYGANVAAGSIDATPLEEIVTGPGPGPVYGPQVRAFTGAQEAIAKVNFYAYGTLRAGVKVGTGDLDGDGTEEIATGAGPMAVFGPHVRAFDYDGTAVAAMPKVSFYAYGTLRYGVEVAPGDVDVDGYAEVLTGPGPGGVFGAHLRGFNYDGATVTPMLNVNAIVFPTRNGLLVASGDLDADGREEILASAGPDAVATSEVRAYSLSSGALTLLTSVVPFSTMGGSHMGSADMTLEGGAELAVTPGFLPGNAGRTKAYSYQGGTLQSMPPWDQDVFPGLGYGATCAIGNVGV